MTRKRPNNKIIEIKPEFESILVCGDRKLCPFIQVLVQEPENIDSQGLGTLVGVFEVVDSSEDSSYIVNYLVSIIKKEYFSKPKRGPIESLEASLHKANLALSNLAEHGNIDWLGKLNALVAVTEKNGLHFSQAGTASAFLLRSKMLTDISDGLSPTDSDPNPLKTFINVSSGRMEKDDKLIITTSSIFDIFSLEEIKKSSLRFSKKEFVQFLRTALGNELERAAVLIADFSDKEVLLKSTPAKKTPKKPLNVFSNETFYRPVKEQGIATETVESALHEEIQRSQSGFIDKKTGHIYIKEDLYNNNDFAKEPAIPFSEKIATILGSLGYFFKKIFSSFRTRLAFLAQSGKTFFQNIMSKKRTSTDYAPSEEKTIFPQKVEKEEKTLSKSIFSEKNKELIFSWKKILLQIFGAISARITPSFRKIKTIVLRMDYQQRLYGLLALALIFIVPYFIAQYLNKKEAQKNTPIAPQIVEAVILPLEKDQFVVRIESPTQTYSAESIRNMISLNSKTYLITTKEIIDVEKNVKFTFPQDFGTPTQSAGMQDLNLIFFINSNKRVLSFSPTSGAFLENSIAIPNETTISAMGTYMTYLYIADSQNNQIYRYPRAEGGFGEKTIWLKENFELNNILDLSIDENLFIAKNNSLSKLFRGKKESFSLESTTTPTEITRISIENESGNIAVLDRKNSRILYFTKDGRLTKQFYHINLQKANGVILDEKNNLIRFSSETELQTIPLN